MRTYEISIHGFLVGPIWWPAGAECFKTLHYDANTQEVRWGEPGTLRDHVLAAAMDGDFQGCAIAQGELVIRRRKGGRTVTRSWPLSRFPSVADCLHSDPDWLPDYGEEEYA